MGILWGWDRGSAPRLRRTPPLDFSGIPASSGAVVSGPRARCMPIADSRSTPREQQEFVALFRDLLERAYVTKIETYTGEPIAYVGESVDGDQATVRTKITTKQNQEVPIDYRMLRQADRWRVYDVLVEGVSLVGNYRTQFDGIIKTSSFEELVKKLKARGSS